MLVGAFDNRTGAASLDGSIESAIERELANSQILSAVSQQRIDDTLRLMTKPVDTPLQPEVAREVCLRDGGIRAFVTGRVDRMAGTYVITASLFDPADGRLVNTTEQHVPNDETLPSAIDQLANHIQTESADFIRSVRHPTEKIEKVTTASLQAAELFSDGLRVFNLGHYHEAEARFNAALAVDPRFPSANIWLAWTCLNLARRAEDCLPFAQRAMDLAPSVSPLEREWIAGSFYMMTGHREAAIREYETLFRRSPDDVWVQTNLLRLYTDGDISQQIDFVARVAAAQPQSLAAQENAALLFLEFRGVDAARPYVDHLRQIAFDPNEPAHGEALRARVWTLLFPAHEFWTEGRASDAARVLDVASKRQEFATEHYWTPNLLGMMRLALGQVRLAEDAFRQISAPGQRRITLAELALAREDPRGVASQVSNLASPDWVVSSLLVRAGDLDAAARFRPTNSTSTNPKNAVWAANEVEEARGNRERISQGLRDGVPWMNLMAGARTFMYSETLARAAAAIGNRAGAINVLEATAPAGAGSFAINTQAGFYSMRDQKLLADLYREDGQIDKAHAIERHLLAQLAVADPDYPLLLELKQRVGK